MRQNRFVLHLSVVLAGVVGWGITQDMRAQSPSSQKQSREEPAAAPQRMRRITQADREAAAARRAAARQAASHQVNGVAGQAVLTGVTFAAPVLAPGGVPDYFNVGNYANSPLPVLDSTGAVVPGTGMRKFVDSLPGLTAANANNLGAFIPVAIPIVGRAGVPADGDYYEIALSDYTQQMHSDLPATKLRGYRDLSPAADGLNHYLGPVIIAQRGRPVRVKFTDQLGIGAAGNLFIPVDTTLMGAGDGPNQTGVDGLGNPVYEQYTQNRAVLHLHGGHTPWISDGTPNQWIVPAGDPTSYQRGVSQQNVPDMPTPPAGSATYFWTNDQSGRFMFYHDHSYGITRLNVYAGEAAGYLIWDQAEEDLISGTNGSGINPGLKKVIPDLGGVYHYGIPLIIQDKTFLPGTTAPAAGQVFSTADPTWGTTAGGQLAAQDPTWDTAKWGATMGSVWFPHVYTPNQNPSDPSGANPFGRWDYGPWFWPPLTATAGLVHGEVPGTGLNGCALGVRCLGVPNPSLTPEAFMDTPVVNGTPYPYMTVQRKAYRFRILNAANDRSWNLQIYYADPANPTEVKMVPATPTPGFPARWPTSNYGHASGVPDPATIGPPIIQIGSESGFLPKPVVIESTPIDYEIDPRSITVTNVSSKGLVLGPAERADIIVDFSSVPDGSTLILYSDSPAPYPGFDARLDYWTGHPDYTSTGGAPPTLPGYGPNTRTIMQFRVAVGGPVAAPFDLVALQNALPAAWEYDQPQPTVPQTSNAGVAGDTWVRIQDTAVTANGVTYPLQPKAIQELFELNYGRMNATLGVELPLTNFNTQTTIPLGYLDPLTESIQNGAPQLWKITHNGVDTHFVHFHLADIQVVNRIGWDGTIRPPDPNEIGWKETIRMNPLEDIVVAVKPSVPANLPTAWPLQPNGSRLPDSVRPLDPTKAVGAVLSLIDPATGNATQYTNALTSFGWEYVWHCHILGHEENDMMRPVKFDATALPPQPAITGVSPASGPAAGGTVITITGANLPPTGTAQVWVGGVQATTVTTNAGATQITATTPANTAGLLADVVVTTPGNVWAPEMQGLTATPNAGTATASLAFAYVATPTVTSVSPIAGPTTGGTVVAITGTNFVPGATAVTFGGVAATEVAVTSTTSITAVTPPNAAGAVDVVVSNSSGSATLAGGFTYGGPPTLAGIVPSIGPASGGTVVVITGSNFVPAATTVTFAGAAATGVVVNAPNVLTAVTPPGIVGPADVAVTSAGGTASLVGAFSYYPVNSTTGVSPSMGPTAGATAVTITAVGTSFGPTTTVTIGGVAATSVVAVSPTVVTVVTPPGVAGPAPIVVTTPPGPPILLAGVAFTYVAPPTVTGIAPTTGPTAGGTPVTITGTNFVVGNTVVTIGGTAATSIAVTSAASLTVTTPPGSAGSAPVVVTTVGGGVTSPTPFTYSVPATVTGISPAFGPLAGGTTVTITGTNFVAGNTAVTIGGSAATGVNVTSATSLTAVTPPGTAGPATVAVSTPAGGAVLAAAGFTYAGIPTVTGITPATGTSVGGTTITITGTNFVVGNTQVMIGGNAATSVLVSSDTTLTAVTPTGVSGPAVVVVSTPGGSVSLAVPFTYYAPVSVTGITPASGPIAGGTSVTITGTNFVAGSTTVTIGGNGATGVTVTSTTSLTATTPPGTPGAASVIVTTPAGSATLTASGFTYALVPTITQIQPANIGTGTLLTITGTNFVVGATTVTFGPLPAGLVTVTTPTSLNVVMPASLMTAAPITVTTAGGSATSNLLSNLLWQDSIGRLYSSLMLGAYPAAGTLLSSTATDWWVMGYRDFNGDGQPDIVWQHPATGAVAIWLMNGTTMTQSVLVSPGPTDWRIVATGDFDGDGKPDLVWQHPTGIVAIWLMNGTALRQAVLVSTNPTDWVIVGAGDFDGDGKTDLVWQHPTGPVAVWLMNGTSMRTAALVSANSTPWRVVGTGDFNGDGMVDLVWQHPVGTGAFWFMNQTTLQSAVAFQTTATPWKVVSPR